VEQLQHLGAPQHIWLPVGSLMAQQVVQAVMLFFLLLEGGRLRCRHALVFHVLGMLSELGELRPLGELGEFSELGLLGVVGEIDKLVFATIPRWLTGLWILLAHRPILAGSPFRRERSRSTVSPSG